MSHFYLVGPNVHLRSKPCLKCSKGGYLLKDKAKENDCMELKPQWMLDWMGAHYQASSPSQMHEWERNDQLERESLEPKKWKFSTSFPSKSWQCKSQGYIFSGPVIKQIIHGQEKLLHFTRIKNQEVGHSTPAPFRESARPLAKTRDKRRVVGPTLDTTKAL